MRQAQFHTLQHDNRKIGYGIIENNSQEETTETAIVYCYPLHGVARMALQAIKVDDMQCRILCVDRPGLGDTSPIIAGGESSNAVRIETHAHDVLAVLNTLGIQYVYVLGVCLGHVFAVQVCRALRRKQQLNNSNTYADTTPVVQGLTLVAPFVAPACPNTWWLSRWGATLPVSVVKTFGRVTSGLASSLVPLFLTPSRLRQLLNDDEWEEADWKEEDLADLCVRIHEYQSSTLRQNNLQAACDEMALGASKDWQERVVDRFAMESGIGLVLDGYERETPGKNTVVDYPIRIHASRDDKLVNIQSIEWVAHRCYGWRGYGHDDNKATIILEDTIHSHENMTFLGGPKRNPVLLYKIAKAWGLLGE